ncbi:vanin-like protein 2 [Musca domestica]|uniref:Vanin-like protein 2 n=1 Tax=Musca domestica TaxID=7370 RepID=A0A9J7HZS5_MUSDO|nr:vanin-like protein 2 [Musca domestica]
MVVYSRLQDRMERILLAYLIAVTAIKGSQQISLPSDPTYNAGVVEFPPAMQGSPKAKVKDNMERMKSIIESDATQNLDILVFPEYVLNNMDMLTYVPDPNDKIVPCELANYDWFLTELSCAARSRNLYVVLNLVEKVKCNSMQANCNNGVEIYNTNVVLDRQGRVISRYRKTHLYRYEWRSTNVLAEPELATFTTDFGVTFGHFICFDMLFYNPAKVLIDRLNITDIIYPTYWFSELPFLTAVQLQEGWAFANNVNLLAADASYPQGQNTGSGIYAGRLGRLTATIHEEPTLKLLTAKVPKRNARNSYQLPTVVKPLFTPQLETPRFTKMSLLRDYNVDIFATKLLEENFTNTKESVCHNNFCCHFDVERKFIQDSAQHEAYRYRLAAFSGNETTFQRIDNSNQSVCALITCTGSELYTCGHIFPENVVVGNKYYFNRINITGNFAKASRRAIMPSTVNAVMMPLSVDNYEWLEVEGNNTIRIEMVLTSPQQDLLTFGIWANYYNYVQNTHNLDEPVMTAMSGQAYKPHNTTSPTSGVASTFLSGVNFVFLLPIIVALLLKY